MRCTNRMVAGTVAIVTAFAMTGCGAEKALTLEKPYQIDVDASLKNQSSDQADELAFFAENLCVTDQSNSQQNSELNTEAAKVAGVFDLDTKEVLYSKNIFDKMYPASITKIMTAYLALKYGQIQDEITVSENATQIPGDASRCGLRAGDTLTLEQLLYGLLLKSGNDAAIAIAEYISGDMESFVQLMNQEASALGATGTHFVNANGLHDEEHYTTAYDIYLIFQAAIQQETFLTIIGTPSYTTEYTNADEKKIAVQWDTTNRFLSGEQKVPDGIQVLGGKTGTTNAAGNCDVLLSKKKNGGYRISVVMNCTTKDEMYEILTCLVDAE